MIAPGKKQRKCLKRYLLGMVISTVEEEDFKKFWKKLKSSWDKDDQGRSLGVTPDIWNKAWKFMGAMDWLDSDAYNFRDQIYWLIIHDDLDINGFVLKEDMIYMLHS